MNTRKLKQRANEIRKDIIDGLGGAVSELLSEKALTPIKRIGVDDVFGKSGPAEELIAEFGLDADGIYNSDFV